MFAPAPALRVARFLDHVTALAASAPPRKNNAQRRGVRAESVSHDSIHRPHVKCAAFIEKTLTILSVVACRKSRISETTVIPPIRWKVSNKEKKRFKIARK